jgi:hypothetical protein
MLGKVVPKWIQRLGNVRKGGAKMDTKVRKCGAKMDTKDRKKPRAALLVPTIFSTIRKNNIHKK